MIQRRTLIVILIVSFLVGIISFLPATQSSAALLILDANNTKDPVTGEPITVKRYSTTHGRYRVWFASYDNVRKFKEDRERYVDNIVINKELPSRKTTETTTSPPRTRRSTTTTQPRTRSNKRRSWWQ